jgi:hypothetical protein
MDALKTARERLRAAEEDVLFEALMAYGVGGLDAYPALRDATRLYRNATSDLNDLLHAAALAAEPTEEED